MGLIDIGANLAHESFAHDLPAVLARARAAEVAQIVVTGSSRASNQHALALAQQYPKQLWCTAGVHPHHAEEWAAEDIAVIRDCAQHPELRALGECGLDYFRNFASHAAQRAAFVAQLELAVELRKPVFLHQRDAHAEFLPILREFRPHLIAACVHCFTDTEAALQDYLAHNCYIGITGWVCDKRRGAGLKALVGQIPLNRLMVETDAPYLFPHNAPKTLSVDGRRNEPATLPYIVEMIAETTGQSVATLARHTSLNAREFFQLPES